MEGLDDLCIAKMGQANEVAHACAPGPRAGACGLHVQSSATYLHAFTCVYSRFAYVHPDAAAHFEAHSYTVADPHDHTHSLINSYGHVCAATDAHSHTTAAADPHERAGCGCAPVAAHPLAR